MIRMNSVGKFLESIGLTLEDIKKNDQRDVWTQIFDFCSLNDIILIFDNSYNKYLLGKFSDLSDEERNEVVDDFCTYAERLLEDTEKIISKHKNDENEWFKGMDNVKFKIDKLTGEADEENEDKWFEGVYDIKSKVNKKVKKNSKRKNKS